MTELCELFKKYNSDKCPEVFHSYSPLYFKYLKNIKASAKNVLEIGIGYDQLMKPICGQEYVPGASLRAWRDFFPNAMIYGADIDQTVLFNEDRIKCFYTDQSNADELEKTIDQIKKESENDNLKFDLIIDDGSHIKEHMELTFKFLKKYVDDLKYYIIEDIKSIDIDFFASITPEDYKCVYVHHGEWDWDGFIIYQKIN